MNKERILEFIKNNFKIILGGLVFLITIFLWSYFNTLDSSQKQVKKQSATVKKNDLQIVISGDGKVKSANTIQLDFPFGGIISEIFVKEGEHVKKGDILAKLDPQDFIFAVKQAETNVNIAKANLTAKKTGSSAAEISLLADQINSAEELLNLQKLQKEIDLKSSRSNIQTVETEKEQASRAFQTARTEAENDIKKTYENAIIAIAQTNVKIDESLINIDRLLGINISSNVASFIGNGSSIDKNNTENLYITTSRNFKNYITQYKDVKTNSEYSAITEKLNAALIIARETSQLLHNTEILLDFTTPSINLSQTEIDNFKNNIFSQHNDFKKQLELLILSQQAIKDVQLNRNAKIREAQEFFIATENKLKTANLALENTEQQANISISNAENQLNLAKNQYKIETETVRTDLALYQAQLTASINQLEQAKYNLSKTVIKAPFDGQVISINQSVGEQITTDKESSFITIQESEDFLSIESFIEEIDIIKIKEGQKVYMTFDALDSVKIEGVVHFVSPVSSIDANGIVTYKVVTVFKPTEDITIREGMTTYLDFVIAEAKNVLAIPVEAVKTIKGVPQVQTEYLTWKKISTGFTDGKKVEILDGLEEDEVILY